MIKQNKGGPRSVNRGRKTRATSIYKFNKSKLGKQVNRLLPLPGKYYSSELEKYRPSSIQATALCPFHKERRPSFSVNLITGAFFCFSCGASGGSIVRFQMQRYQQTVKQAMYTITGGAVCF